MYLDLEYEARTNGQFQDRLRLLQAQVGQWHRRSLNDEGLLVRYHEAVLELIRFCRFNFVFLTPFFWPKFRGAPLTFGDYPFAWSLFQLQFGGFTVVRASRQIGKSTALSARQHIFAELIPGFKSTYIVPHYKQLQTYCNRTREIERAMVGFSAKRTGDLRKNLAFKEFPNGSTIEMHNVLTSALPVRGMSADELVFDEAQDFDPDLEIEVTQIQAASHMAVTVYAGTSLTTDTLLEKKYSESSQGVWVTRCPACGHDNIPLPDHGVLDSIQPMGPACCKCSRPIDVRTGRFIHADTNKLNAGHVGLHVPQIILPAVVNNPVRWGKIYEMKLKQAGNRKFLQEILGIAVEEG